jgi:hypothetical protein
MPIVVATATACAGAAVAPILVRTELHFASSAAPPMHDRAGISATSKGLLVTGLLNESPPCFEFASGAMREGTHVVVRVAATHVEDVCMTIVAGAVDYEVALPDLGAGTYDVEVLHRTQFSDGRVEEARIALQRVRLR